MPGDHVENPGRDRVRARKGELRERHREQRPDRNQRAAAAFLSAGAGSVIATTWSVADRTSYQVMEGFYREWIAGGRNKARALRESQLAMLRQLRKGGITLDGVVLHESPWLWAGFVLVGNP